MPSRFPYTRIVTTIVEMKLLMLIVEVRKKGNNTSPFIAIPNIQKSMSHLSRHDWTTRRSESQKRTEYQVILSSSCMTVHSKMHRRESFGASYHVRRLRRFKRFIAPSFKLCPLHSLPQTSISRGMIVHEDKLRQQGFVEPSGQS